MRFRSPSYRQLNYYSSSSWSNDNKPLTKTDILMTKLFFGIPIAIVIFIICLFMLAQIVVAFEDGVGMPVLLMFAFAIWLSRKLKGKGGYKFK